MVSYNKRVLNLTVGAPGSTHDATFLRNTGLFKQILNGQGLPDKTVDLGNEYGKIPLVTIRDSAFPRFSWLRKNFNYNTKDERERYYNIILLFLNYKRYTTGFLWIFLSIKMCCVFEQNVCFSNITFLWTVRKKLTR